MKQMPAPFVGGRSGSRNEEFMIKMLERMGGKGSLFETGSAKKGHEYLMEMLRCGKPVYTYVDMAYLPYLALPGDAHFGAHTVVVYGIDEQEDTVYLSDRGKGPLTVSVEDLKNARSSKFPPFPPRNKILEIEVPEQPMRVKEGILDAMRECCQAMQNPPISNFGLAGIRKWANIIPGWPKQFQGLNLYGCLMNVYIYIEIGGTGGRAFRPMYARFLREASSLVENPELESVADLFEESGKAWSDVAKAALPDSWDTLGKARRLMYEKNQVFEEQEPGAFERMMQMNAELDDVMKQASLQLEERDLTSLLQNLQQKVMNLYENETRAITALSQRVS
ncbi:MAG: BtrH N-terminal domain-containing protein [Theionarchaea archaeon]|nr:BtrH N-terminal domain-containing protein [Theionarchaea archaeon]